MNRRPKAAAAGADTGLLYWWLLLCLFFEYARPSSFVPGLSALHLNSLLPLTLLLVTCFKKDGLRPLDDIFKDKMAKWILIYFGLIVFSIVHARVKMYTITVISTTLGYVFLWLLILRIITSLDRLRGVMKTLIFAHLFLLAMNPQAILNPSERHYITGATFLGDGNDFSLSICILLPMAIELALSAPSRFSKAFWWLILLVLIFAIVGSSSRGGTLGMASVVGYLWLRSPRKGLTIAGVVLAAIAVLAYAPDTYLKRMGTMSNYEEDGSAMGRIHAWQAGINMFVDNPVLGVGAGHFPVSFGTKYRPASATSPRWKTAHSMYFLILGELALPGIITLFVLLIGSVRASTRMRRMMAARLARDRRLPGFLNPEDRMLYMLNGSMLGFSIAGAFLSVAYYPHVFVLAALMIVGRRIAQQQLEAPAPVKAEPAAGTAAVPA